LIEKHILLNQKGYETLASCGGHYEGGCSENFDVDIKFLKKAQDDPTCFIREIKENTFDCYIENRKAYIYILFKNKYNFDSLPEKCNPYEDEYEGRKRISIDYKVNYFDEHNQKRKRNDIEKDLDEYCNILYHWVEELPDINKRKDD